MDCILELLLNIFPGLSYFFGRNNVRKGEIASVLGGESFYANEFSNALCLVFFKKFRSIQMIRGNELKFNNNIIIFNIQSLYEEKKKFHYIFVPVLFLSRTLIVLKIKNLRRKRKMEENLSKITTVRVKLKIFKIK